MESNLVYLTSNSMPVLVSGNFSLGHNGPCIRIFVEALFGGKLEEIKLFITEKGLRIWGE